MIKIGSNPFPKL